MQDDPSHVGLTNWGSQNWEPRIGEFEAVPRVDQLVLQAIVIRCLHLRGMDAFTA